MKKFHRILATGLAAVSCIGGFAACGKNGGVKNRLTIRYYVGGYGKTWLEDAVKAFCETKEGVTYKLIDDAGITSRAPSLLRPGKSAKDDPDIIMAQGGAWEEWASQGWLEPLDDVFNTEVSTSAGNQKIADYLEPEAKNMSYSTRTIAGQTFHPYVMPWGSLECSFVYNEEMLFSTTRRSTGTKWDKVPETVAEFVEYCDDVETEHNVAAIAWSVKDMNWFQFPIYVWWAQQQGVFESRMEGEGSFYDFFDYGSVDVWKQSGISSAIDIWKSIIANGKKVVSGKEQPTWSHSLPNQDETTMQTAQAAFVGGKAAMILSGSFLENEMKAYEEDGKIDFTMKMMRVPFSENCQTNADGSKTTINFVSNDDIMLIPAKATNKSLAKEFLAYLCQETQLLEFTKKTGCMRPFRYDPVALTANTGYEWSSFQKSSFNLYTESDVNLYLCPGNKTDYKDYSRVYRFLNPGLFTGVGIESAGYKMLELTGKQIMVDGHGDYESVYAQALKNWDDWMDEMGLAD